MIFSKKSVPAELLHVRVEVLRVWVEGLQPSHQFQGGGGGFVILIL